MRNVDAGGHTCGQRIDYLVSSQGLTPMVARQRVAAEFPAQGGPCSVAPAAVPATFTTPATPAPVPAPGGRVGFNYALSLMARPLDTAVAAAALKRAFPSLTKTKLFNHNNEDINDLIAAGIN